MREILHRSTSTAGIATYEGVTDDWQSFCKMVKMEKTKLWIMISLRKVKATDEHCYMFKRMLHLYSMAGSEELVH